ncbi:MAG TPA: GNAT family N-acetyltransferase [Dehalococcoidia bacterium]|nr:GNAT family N-acetyltransferase [Dehalococcoidia bacterium]
MNNRPCVTLSPLEDEHIFHYMSLSSDPELIDTMGWRPFLPDEKERFLQFTQVVSAPGLNKIRAVVFSIISPDGQAIGYTSIKGIDDTEGRAEVGIAIMDKEYRGHGYGTTALRQAVNYAFGEIDLVRIMLTVFPSNRRAVRAYEKIGFRKTEVLKDSWLLPDGQYADMWLMELSCDWLTAVSS